MVSTIQIKPAFPLQPFVSCYALRSFTTDDRGILKPMFAVHESYMTFFLQGGFCDLIDIQGRPNSRISHAIVNLLTESQGGTYYKGSFVLFSVQFKCNGIPAIFGIPQKMLVNHIISIADILPDLNMLAEQLSEDIRIERIAAIMNAYLLRKLAGQRQKKHTVNICAASEVILKSRGMVNIDKLAYCANMSPRNFERRFSDEVGMAPKLYTRIARFFTAIEDKALHPYKSWTDIVYEYNFYDQAHFIKEVKNFSFKTPEELFMFTPPVAENYVSKVEY
jgi:AraC-like DNA-binding protein